ncbi:hypothetical protein [Streptomyces sp. NBC_01198]|uniref:hypothetical protein n=1 Tax=Streptomyces sp. NBC_01198 TaxID=2903769 RepID=UPI002E105182|nr:hypothetical protein OG702_17740 [Streptomyces sp. NBC_01198]
MPTPSDSGAGDTLLHPPARPSATPSAGATGSGHPTRNTYEHRHSVRHHGHSYSDRATSLVPDEEPRPTPTLPAPTGSGVGRQEPSAPSYQPGRRVLRLLPLGAGMILVGLGLGVLGLRLRRP